MTPRLSDNLAVLHQHYVTAIHEAVEADDQVRAGELAADYDRDALLMVASFEGRLHELPTLMPGLTSGRERRRARRSVRAA